MLSWDTGAVIRVWCFTLSGVLREPCERECLLGRQYGVILCLCLLVSHAVTPAGWKPDTHCAAPRSRCWQPTASDRPVCGQTSRAPTPTVAQFVLSLLKCWLSCPSVRGGDWSSCDLKTRKHRWGSTRLTWLFIFSPPLATFRLWLACVGQRGGMVFHEV